MEKAVRRFRMPLYLIVIILAVIAAAAVGVYFLTNGSEDKKPSRGTYVMMQLDERYDL
ncbi:MAG: hypothetical protein N2376_11340 [Clostridia bacterium]|nr:hypothetical protein [Clostridia bacterium]